MHQITIPITLPFGLLNEIDNWKSKKFILKINELRELSKHEQTNLEFYLTIKNGHPDYKHIENLEYNGLIISNFLISHYINSSAQESHKYSIEIDFVTDIQAISKEYFPVSTDIYNDIISSLCLFLNASLNTLTFAKFSPIIFDNDNIVFQGKLAYLYNPGQDWFRSYEILKIVLDDSLKEQINSTAKFYESMLPYVRGSITPLCLNELSNLADLNKNAIKYLHRYGRVLSEIIRMHPSYDYSAIVGLLTALIEGFLLINGENRYKFKIRITNLLNDNSLGTALTKIYDSRSSFFHTGEYEKIKDIFYFLTIDFLLVVLNEIVKFQTHTEIKQETFDYPVKLKNE
jgi:hypothetical protein